MKSSKYQNILAIESSCDETAAAVIQNGRTVLSSVVASQIPLHQRFGGVVPEVAARAHVEQILPVITQALHQAFGPKKVADYASDIEAIAVTVGPGLVGSLLVGVNAAKTLAYLWHKPLIPVNHILGHIYSPYLERNFWDDPIFPTLSLVASGGHTSLILSRGFNHHQLVGQTRDDAAGEAFDKAAQLLGLPYPGGPSISQAAKKGDAHKYSLPRGLAKDPTFDFSFSGLKTALKQLVHQLENNGVDLYAETPHLAAAFQASAVESLVSKTLRAAQNLKVTHLCLAGGVAANQLLRDQMSKAAMKLQLELTVPDLKYCTDNAAMIGAAAYAMTLARSRFPWYDVNVNISQKLKGKSQN